MSTKGMIFLDIETLPPSGGGHLERIRAGIKAPAQYKKPESIAEWMTEIADRMAAEEHAKLGLNGLYGEIAVIGYAVEDGGITTVVSDGNDAKLLASAFASIEEEATSNASGLPMPMTVVGHNIEFDARFLFHRAVRHGVRIPACMRRAFDPDKGRYNTFDTMKVWSGYRDYVKLRDLARELLGDKNEDIDGSQVAALWQTDRAAVARHCFEDVARVRNLYKRFKAVL